MPDYSKIGRNNKNRGREFERKVARLLGWTRVPYSGAMTEWGGGDVMDGFYKRKGFWAAECKTQQPGPLGTLSIKQKWLEQMRKCTANGRQGIIITRNVGSQKVFVVMPEASFKSIEENLMPSEIRGIFTVRPLKTYGIGMGFVIPVDFMATVAKLRNILRFTVYSVPLEHYDDWVMMSLDTFKYFIDKFELWEQDVEPEDGE